MDAKLKILFFFVDLILPLLVGYLLYRSGKFHKESLDRLMIINLLVFAPALAIISLWGVKLEMALIWLPIIGIIMQVIPGLIGFHQAQRQYSNSLEQGSYVLASMLSNRGVVGSLSVFILFGQVGYAYARLVMLLSEIFLYGFCFPVANFFYQRHHGGEANRISVRAMVLNRNQIPLLGVLAGLALNFSGLHQVDVLSKIFPYLLHVSAWLFILPVGFSMDFSAMNRYWQGIWGMLGIKFVTTPLLVFTIAWLVGYRGNLLTSLIILSCSPTAINAVVTAKLHKLNVHLAMAAMVATTAVYLVVFFPLLFLLGGR